MPTPTATDYGFSDAFFNSDPELKKLLAQAKRKKWTANQFQAAFMKTKWYRGRQSSIRQWTDLTTRDPAEAKAKIAERTADLADRFTQLGLTVNSSVLSKLAVDSLKFAFSDGQLSNILANYVSYQPGNTAGSIAGMETQIKDLAWQYGISVTDSQMNDWIRGMVSKTYTEENINDFVRDAAKSKYAGLTAQIDTGRTVRDIAGQHINAMSRLLEVGDKDVNLDDPLLANALQGTVDPKTGLPVSQTVFQFEQAIKKDKRWLNTKNARDSMSNAMFQIGQDWGLIG